MCLLVEGGWKKPDAPSARRGRRLSELVRLRSGRLAGLARRPPRLAVCEAAYACCTAVLAGRPARHASLVPLSWQTRGGACVAAGGRATHQSDLACRVARLDRRLARSLTAAGEVCQTPGAPRETSGQPRLMTRRIRLSSERPNEGSGKIHGMAGTVWIYIRNIFIAYARQCQRSFRYFLMAFSNGGYCEKCEGSALRAGPTARASGVPERLPSVPRQSA